MCKTSYFPLFAGQGNPFVGLIYGDIYTLPTSRVLSKSKVSWSGSWKHKVLLPLFPDSSNPVKLVQTILYLTALGLIIKDQPNNVGLSDLLECMTLSCIPFHRMQRQANEIYCLLPNPQSPTPFFCRTSFWRRWFRECTWLLEPLWYHYDQND